MNVAMDRRITIERKSVTKATGGSQTVAWAVLAVVYAERRDALPSRAESMRDGMEQRRKSVRFRFRWRDDVDSSMRIRDGAEVLQIVGQPAEIGRREFVEVAAEAVDPAGK